MNVSEKLITTFYGKWDDSVANFPYLCTYLYTVFMYFNWIDAQEHFSCFSHLYAFFIITKSIFFVDYDERDVAEWDLDSGFFGFFYSMILRNSEYVYHIMRCSVNWWHFLPIKLTLKYVRWGYSELALTVWILILLYNFFKFHAFFQRED